MHDSKENVGKESLYGAVLAGGRSTRMGRDKRFLKLDGEFLVDRAVKLLANAIGDSIEQVYLCGDVPNRNCIPDALPGLGPLGGVFSALRRVRTQTLEQEVWLLVIPVDMPLLTPGALRDLILAIPCIENDCSSAVAYEDFEMPFIIRCDSFTENTLTAICHSSLSSSRSIRFFQDAVGVHRIPLMGGACESMLNANSPRDWVRVSNGGLL